MILFFNFYNPRACLVLEETKNEFLWISVSILTSVVCVYSLRRREEREGERARARERASEREGERERASERTSVLDSVQL